VRADGPNFWPEARSCSSPPAAQDEDSMLMFIALGLFCAAFSLVLVRTARPTRSIAHILYDVEHPREKP
jgi:hypothetical protein